MKEHTRNLIVGLTVLVALAMLCGLILIFAGLPETFRTGYVVHLISDSSHDIHQGDSVYLSGLPVGRVTSVRFDDPHDPAGGVLLVARIEKDVNIPGNVKAVVFTRGFVGSPYLALVPEGPDRFDEATGRPLRFLPRDGSVSITVEHRGSGLIPPELKDSMAKLGGLAESLNALISPEPSPIPTATTQAADTQAAEPAGGLRGAVDRLNRTLDAVHAVMGDQANQANIKKSLANLADATQGAAEAMDALKDFAAQARKTMENFSQTSDVAQRRIDELAGKLIEDAERISALMTTLNKAAARIESGHGTAGKLLNDPKLYNNLVDAAAQMTKLTREFGELVKEWKDNGIPLKVK